MKRVLILCTGNSCRSQMAEGLWRHLCQGRHEVYSAGTHPTKVNPLAIRAMGEIGLDISHHQSQSVDEFIHQTFDLVITVCDNAKEHCPIFPGNHTMLHWPFDDPADAKGSDDEKMPVFRRVRDEIRVKIADYLKNRA